MVFDYRDGNHNAYMGPSEVRYKSLRNPHTRIRLAYLHAGSWSDAIAITLRVHVRSDQPVYVALSYTWGLSTSGQSILLNGHHFAVTDNLHAALRRLRLSDRSRVLWIDAICINQDDVVERAAQIRAMQSIYNRAVRVMVWLGDDPLSTAPCDSLPQHHGRPSNRDRILSKLDRALRSTQPSWQDRIWTLQEFISAQNEPMFLFADESKTLSRLRKALAQVASSEVASMDRILAFTQALNDRQQLLASLAHDSGMSELDRFLVLSVAITGVRASDPLDYVYAILNLMSRNIAWRIDVSYQITPATLFSTATRAVIQGTQSLAPLALKRLEPARSIITIEKQYPDLPSWALDFSAIADVRSCKTFFPSDQDIRASLQYQICDSTAEARIDHIYDKESERVPHILSVSGTFQDRIREIIPLRLLLPTRWHSPKIWTAWRRRTALAPASDDFYHESNMRGNILRNAVLRMDATTGRCREDGQPESFFAAIDNIFRMKKGSRQRRKNAEVVNESNTETEHHLEYWLDYLTAMSGYAVFFTTQGGRYGLASSAAQVGDSLAIISSMRAPVVLSSLGSAETRLYADTLERLEIEGPELFAFRGFAYVHDDGRLGYDWQDGKEGLRQRILLA